MKMMFHFNMNELLDEVTEIPFTVFWDKYLEKGGINFWQTRSNAVWWMLNENQRKQAFIDVCKTGTKDPAYEYLKKYYEGTR